MPEFSKASEAKGEEVSHIPHYILESDPMQGPADLVARGWSPEAAAYIWAHRDDRATVPARALRIPRPSIREGRKRKYISRAVRKRIFERDAYRCVTCADWHDLEVDHIIPVAIGGTDDEANLQTMCGPCNLRKGANVR